MQSGISKISHFGAIACCLLLTAGLFAQIPSGVRGILRDAESGETLIGAVCRDTISGRRSITNTQGIFFISLTHNNGILQCSYPGYEPAFFSVSATDSIQEFRLSPGVSLGQVDITTAAEYRHTAPGLTSLPINRLRTLPSFGGEPDVLKTLTIIPGFQGGREGYSNLHVRGGGRDQNLVLLDGAPVYNTSHGGGFLSMFNAEILKKVDVYKGGFPARYGDRLSSVLDIRVRDGNRERFTGKVNVGLLTSSITAEGPVCGIPNTSFLVSLRYLNYDILSLPTRLQFKRNGYGNYLQYRVHDINAKINHTFKDQGQLFVNLYQGGDYNAARSVEVYSQQTKDSKDAKDIRNTAVTLGYLHPWGTRAFWQVSAHYSVYFGNFSDRSASTSNYGTAFTQSFQFNTSASRLVDRRIRWQADFWASPNHHIIAGVEGLLTGYSFGLEHRDSLVNNDSIASANVLKTPSSIYRNMEMALFAEDDWRLNSRLSINYGVRYSSYWYYSPGKAHYDSWEPRVALRQLIGQFASVKLAYTYMAQYQHQLIEKAAGFERERWVSAVTGVAPQRAHQWSAGWFSQIQDRHFTYSIEAYYKRLNHLIETVPILKYAPDYNQWSQYVYKEGKGVTYGVECQAEYRTGRWEGTLGYTLSWNYRQFEQINQGKRYPFIYDRRHILNLTGSYRLNEKWQVAAIFNLQSGSAFTLPVATLPTTPFFFTYQGYNGVNNAHLPLYHRLDVAFHKNWKSKRKQREQHFSINVYNLYNHHNVLFMYIKEQKLHTVSQFGFLPSLSYGFNF